MVYQLFQVKQLTFGCNIFVCEIVTWAKNFFFVKNKYDSSIDKRCRVKKVFKTNSGRDDFLEL